jgi:hypothetical protein
MIECPHSEVLVYFDRFNACIEYWEICDACGARINEQLLSSPEEVAERERTERWMANYSFNIGPRDV